MYIGDAAGVFALHTAAFQGFVAGVLGDALDIGMDGQFFLRGLVHLCHADKNLVAHSKAVMGITDPVPCQIPRHDGTLHAENLHTDGFVGNGNNASLHHTPLTDAVLAIGIRAEIEKLALAHHGFAAAGDYTAALGVNAENNKVDFCAQHIAQQLHLADGHTVGTVGSAGGDHHFFERNDDAEAVVVHNGNRLAAVGLLDTAQRCGEDAPCAVGVVNFVPGSSFAGILGFDFVTAFNGQHRGIRFASAAGRGSLGRLFFFDRGGNGCILKLHKFGDRQVGGKNVIVHFHGKSPFQFQVLL